jgi:predicted nucleic acid-binding protein
MYLLDTDILSNLMKRTPSSVLVARVARVPTEHQFTSSITLGEVVYGAHRLRGRTAALLERIEDTLFPNLPVLSFDTSAAHRYGEIRAELEQRGRRRARSSDRPGARSEGHNRKRAPLPAGSRVGDRELAG